LCKDINRKRLLNRLWSETIRKVSEPSRKMVTERLLQPDRSLARLDRNFRYHIPQWLIFSIFFLSRSGMVLIETSRYTSGFNLGEPNMFADWIHRMFRLELMIDEDAREGVFLRLSRIRIRIPTSCRLLMLLCPPLFVFVCV
ncbi:heat shock protein 90, partial [Striga asiatica]